MKTVYLCGPIADCTDDECQKWRHEVEANLGGLFNFKNPMVRDYRKINTKNREHEIVIPDKYDIDQSDILFANITKISVGSIMEIFYAYIRDKQVLVVCPFPNPSPWLVYHANKVFTNLEDGIEYLRRQK